MEKATLRTYYTTKHKDSVDKYCCPICGKRQTSEFAEYKNGKLIDVCGNCETEIELIYRNIKRRNF